MTSYDVTLQRRNKTKWRRLLKTQKPGYKPT